MEIGSFYEVYEVNNDQEKIGKASIVANLLNIQLTKKNKSILENNRSNPFLCGIPSIALDRHLQKLTEPQKYTIVKIEQTTLPPKVERKVTEIISPGTIYDYEKLSKNNNYFCTLIIQYEKDIPTIGGSIIDCSTG